MNTTHINNFKQLYEKGAWFGDTYLEKLEDVTEKEAFTQPAKGIHSIAELVSHVIYWRTPVIKRLKGEKDYQGSVDSPDNWVPLDKLKAKGWKTILKEFDESQKQMLKLLADAKPEFFAGEYSPGRSWEYVTEGIVQHDIYHLGQLGLVKKMVRNS
ncbi:MAG TPA: DinB family protein [Cyclobacteriaceae bacterium]|nr:DinB family protein [Cyclobacteriaceae bacterium]